MYTRSVLPHHKSPNAVKLRIPLVVPVLKLSAVTMKLIVPRIHWQKHPLHCGLPRHIRSKSNHSHLEREIPVMTQKTHRTPRQSQPAQKKLSIRVAQGRTTQMMPPQAWEVLQTPPTIPNLKTTPVMSILQKGVALPTMNRQEVPPMVLGLCIDACLLTTW